MRRQIDKRMYKQPHMPVCHDFNVMTRTISSLDLVVGFSTGQIQYINPIQKLTNSTFNDNVRQQRSALSHLPPLPLHLAKISIFMVAICRSAMICASLFQLASMPPYPHNECAPIPLSTYPHNECAPITLSMQ